MKLKKSDLVKLRNGTKLTALNAASYMDDEIREELHNEYCDSNKSQQQFFRDYCRLHKKRFKETFILDTENPQI